MSAVSDSGKSITRRLKQTLSRSPASGPPPRPPPAKPALPIQARDPALSSYINAKALGRPEGLPFHELFKALFDAINGDKTGRQQLYGILLRLFFYEELPPDLIQQLVPLLQAQGGKDARVLRGLYHLLEVYVGPGSAGTPTLYDPSLVGRRPDEKVLQAVLSEAWSLLQQPDLDPIVKRATFVLAAAAARGSESIRKELVSQVQRAITAADSLAELAASGGAAAAKGRAAARPAALDWDLQHTAFLAVRLSGAATGADAISRSSFVGVGSADPVGARHALALVAEVAYRDAGYVAREMGALVAAAARQYEASGPGPAATPGQGVNLEDPWARLHLARTCAYVLHSDQSSGDVSRDGAPFWHMLHLLATRDAVDMVRFGALEAMTGAVPAAGGVTLLGVGAGAGGGKHSGSGAGKQSREDVVFQQRRGRAWRLLVAQAGLQVTIPGAPGAAAAPMKLIECLGRLLAAAVRSSANRASRFVVACNVIGSLAESCLASQSVGSSRHNTSPDCDRVLSGLAAGLGAALEADMGAAQRCACLEALLYLQAAGYPTGLTPAKMVAAAGSGGAAWAGGLQDLLLSTVLKCAKARPKLATAFLGYATAAVAISPVGIDLGKVTGLWDAAVAAGREGKEAGLAAALDTLQSPPPSSTQLRAGAGGDADVARAVREEDGWNAFVATAAWWVGEHANSLCGEYAGRKLLPQGAPSNGDLASAAAQDGVAALERESGRNPTLSRILLALQSVALTAVWQVRLAAVHALAKIAVRSGEPFRLQCYAVLAACSGGSSDPLGLQSATAPALAVLDKIYATQAVLGRLWEEHGDDVEGWPDDVVASLARRSRHITLQVEKYVCSVPKERYAVLGHRALSVLAAGKEEEVGGVAGALSFLSGQRSEELTQDVLSDRTGSEIAKSKNQEIESILSGGSEGGAIKITSGRSDVSGTLEDKNKEIETLLSGGGPSAASDPWAAPSNSFSSFNAFLQESEGMPASPSFAAQPGGSDETPRLGRAGASADFGGQATTTSWFAAPEDGQQAQQLGERQQSLARPATPPGPPGRRTATVLHMFVADYNQPDELSVFEGDQVEVLDDVDGWMLVRDPSGQQGLVPTSYLQLDQPAAAAGRGAGGPLRQTSSHTREPTLGNVFEEVAQQPAAADTRQRRGHARTGSLDYQTSKEDYLDNIFSAAPFSAPDLPTTPEDYPLPAASEDARLFNGGASSTDEGTAIAGQQLRSDGGQRAAEFGSPSFTGDSWARSESATATQPLRGESWARTSSMDAGGGSFSPATKDTATSRPQEFARQGSVSSNNPFTPSHRRTLSGASSHRRSLSGGSGDLGSLPTTPSRMEGQERTIVAGFDAEMEGELSVAPGERVKVHSDVGGWVRVVRLADHKSGLVPSWAVGGEA